MKTIILSVLFAIATISCFAQGNLQFSQVVQVSLTTTFVTTANFPSVQQSFTVPSGTVWKVESAMASYESITTGLIQPSAYITLDNKNLTYSNTSTPTYWASVFPLWLPAGTYTLKLVYPNSPTVGNKMNGSISAIEFNIVP
ncbi:hypothetical protein BH09BAC1_BH09BAC1_02610 [soil metagenome]